MDKKNKTDRGSKKKKLIRTKRETIIIRVVTVLVILAAAFLIWYLIDSRSYVASVAGHRIKKYEYEFQLRQQIITSRIGVYLANPMWRRCTAENRGRAEPRESAKNKHDARE